MENPNSAQQRRKKALERCSFLFDQMHSFNRFWIYVSTDFARPESLSSRLFMLFSLSRTHFYDSLRRFLSVLKIFLSFSIPSPFYALIR